MGKGLVMSKVEKRVPAEVHGGLNGSSKCRTCGAPVDLAAHTVALPHNASTAELQFITAEALVAHHSVLSVIMVASLKQNETKHYKS